MGDSAVTSTKAAHEVMSRVKRHQKNKMCVISISLCNLCLFNLCHLQFACQKIWLNKNKTHNIDIALPACHRVTLHSPSEELPSREIREAMAEALAQASPVHKIWCHRKFPWWKEKSCWMQVKLDSCGCFPTQVPCSLVLRPWWLLANQKKAVRTWLWDDGVWMPRPN